jgi:Na+/H+-dicarboxylate symporter
MSAEWLSVLEMVVLGPLAALLVLILIPSAFDVEWACIGHVGTVRTPGDEYIATFAVFGTVGWFAVLVSAVFAGIFEARRVAAILPLVWFAVLVGAALVVAASIGPELCPA